MYKAADIRGTLAYTQIRRAIGQLNVGPVEQAIYQRKLVNRYLKNLNEQHPDGHWIIADGRLDDLNLDSSFIWRDTPEGHEFWWHIQDDERHPEELMRVLNQKRAARLQVEQEEVAPAAPRELFIDEGQHIMDELFAGAVPVAPKIKAPKAKVAPKQVGWWVV